MHSQQMTLRQRLQKKVEQYHKEDNPDPQKVSYWTTFTTFAYGHSEVGRNRADDYLQNVINKSEEYSNEYTYDDNALLKIVYKDIVDKESVLAPSTTLRMRLLQGICHHFDFSMGLITGITITDSINHSRKGSPEEIQIAVMLDLLQDSRAFQKAFSSHRVPSAVGNM